MNDELEAAARARRLLVACDFDGTLSHLVDRPEDARPAPGAMEALVALDGLPGTTVAIVSGRQRSILRSLTAAPDSMVLVGSHGAELGDLRIEASEARRLDRLERRLAELAAGHPGAHVERKPGSVAFHLRRITTPSPDLEQALAGLTEEWQGRVIRGKEVVEWATPGASKGDALSHLRAVAEADLVLYAGDDVTDEDAFAVLAEHDIGIKVGEGASLARHRVDSPSEMVEVLRDVVKRRKGRGPHPVGEDQPISR